METKISQWGNSLGLRIPQTVAEEIGLADGTAVELKVEDHQLVIRPKRYSLASLLAQVTAENRHGEIDTGKSVGAEAW